MAKLAHLLMENQLKSLETISLKLKKNDYKIAGKLYSLLKRHCVLNSIQMKLDNKGRIKKAMINLNGEKVLAKPIIVNNKLLFFYKKNYYSSLDSINLKIEYTCEIK